MIREVNHNGRIIRYDLQYKKVKNINLRIKPDGTVNVSANKYVSRKTVDEIVLSKADFIIKALEKYEKNENKAQIQYFSESELHKLITEFCEKIYPYYERKGIKYPEIKFRRMVSRWGSCHPIKGIVTFNINLMYSPRECVEYVVWHEFTHFFEPNHSKRFYERLSEVCPDWKECRKILKTITIRGK